MHRGLEFVLTRYFKDQPFHRQAITKHEHYTQRTMIAALFGYRLWSADFLTQLAQQAAQIVRRDVTPGFIVAEFIAWLNERKIVRPGHTTLQTLISEALSAERGRLGGLLAEMLDESARQALAQMLVRDDTLSELAALKQDAKNFKWRQMANEREKRARLEPLYLIARTLLPKLRSRNAICITTQVWRISTRCMICAASRLSKHIYICCATLGSATGNSPTISSTP